MIYASIVDLNVLVRQGTVYESLRLPAALLKDRWLVLSLREGDGVMIQLGVSYLICKMGLYRQFVTTIC